MEQIAGDYAACEAVRAVALGGSRSSGLADDDADIDLYVYSDGEVPLEVRRAIASRTADVAEVDNRFWEPGDEWVEPDGTHFDVMFRNTAWIEEQLARSLDRHEASAGYSTCFWANVLKSRLLFDRDGWFAGLQQKSRSPYPEELRRAIVAKNHPILRSTLSSYYNQIATALERDDVISLNHRITAFLASYTDVVFAINRQPHPGEKRQVAWVEKCPKRPPEFTRQIIGLIEAPYSGILAHLDSLADDLDRLLEDEGLL